MNKRAGDYGTAIQAAAWFGNATNVKLLLDNGAKINTDPIGIYGNELQGMIWLCDQPGNTLTVKFAAAVYSGNEETIRLLIAHGANGR